MKWKGTTGEWVVTEAEQDSSGRGVYRVLTYIRPTKEQFKVNSKLIENAAETIQKCDLLPSELLAQRDELLEQCKKVVEAQFGKGALANLNGSISVLRELIKKIEE